MSPIHDYRCVKCGKVIEDIYYPTDHDHKIFEKHLACKCGGRLKRVVPKHTSFTMKEAS